MKRNQDHYTRSAKKDGYPARSVYKLMEIDRKYRLLFPDAVILDIGASPGSWSLYASRKAVRGKVVSVDLKPLECVLPKNCLALTGDAFDAATIELIMKEGPFNLVLSDAAPSTTGNRTVDTTRSFEIAENVISLYLRVLKPGGSMVVKIFQGSDERDLAQRIKNQFRQVKFFKPEASRSESFETFLIALSLGS